MLVVYHQHFQAVIAIGKIPNGFLVRWTILLHGLQPQIYSRLRKCCLRPCLKNVCSHLWLKKRCAVLQLKRGTPLVCPYSAWICPHELHFTIIWLNYAKCWLCTVGEWNIYINKCTCCWKVLFVSLIGEFDWFKVCTRSNGVRCTSIFHHQSEIRHLLSCKLGVCSIVLTANRKMCRVVKFDKIWCMF